MKTLIALITTLALFMSAPAIAEDHGHEEAEHAHEKHGDHKEDGHDNEKRDAHGEHGGHAGENGSVKLTPAQIKQAGIESQVIQRRKKVQTINAPGGVDFNAYKLADITTLVDGAIHARHVRLGDEVKKGQKLVTLTSSALAQSEAGYLRAEAEHRKSKLDLKRIEGLAKEKIVSQARLQQATSIHQAAHANLAAARASLSSYGLSGKKIDALIRSRQYGQLTLYAPSSGTIVADDFRIGQHIAAGTRLMQVVDESTVWVEVKLSQSQMGGIATGRSAVVSTKDNAKHYKARVINVHHQLDEKTRTVGVRLEVQNPEDALHPGMFVSAEIETDSAEESLLLPENAIQRQGSELIVFVEEEPGHFERREVRVGKPGMGFVPVLEGVKEGESVVVKGAFVLASELAKSGFEVHNH
ncbi:membrane fusion protein, cobalt-zinc-cadmium efflux system [Mariprofundus micogutta]|uniref:Membrane fusion protein, cobalt-zinc-cadmium efflux system n=1 Tax=Mariprofundus micogutta TaxID=1921010 RepID=A0A1L8CNC8_9PROT|nr:efflux RND transporter periplasmic adaptor subunit [Mariprofundus micogutta]GAV20407.1 membrane fusion protein, cobalt-zinc-cadmium efflux system [Mariprofundus micogutta]